MWAELLCGLVIYKLLKRFFYDDDTFDLETSKSDSIFSVADRIQKVYGGKVFLGLRIPDADTSSRQNIDIVLVTKREAVVISVKDFPGSVTIDKYGSWIVTEKNKTEKFTDPVVEVKRQVGVLEGYLEQRGVALPDEYLSGKVILTNPKSSSIHSINFPSEVISFDQWVKLKPEQKSMLSSWIKDAFCGGKKEMQDAIHQQLHFILGSAPMWDRLELKENKNLLGEFLEFKGKPADIQSLRNIKRSKVSRFIIQKSSMFGLARSTIQLLYSARDYRNEGDSVSDWKEITVRSSTEVLFQPHNSSKVSKFKLSSITSMSLSA
ncbi:hypothetical protein IFM89_005641 [Coptis chinensis]|uniref:NERD domain-containing protein n=1 Tax=Coptis chinensis TaxID=261450 RepID=A0A835M8T1_9MAGN|nr:hypothetical protein IFM89_005641 [Coptis chinensis]